MRVLIVDDEPEAAEYLLQLLESHCKAEFTDVAHNGAEALEKLNHGSFELVFLDIQMPSMDGFELLSALPAHSRPGVIFTSAHTEYAWNAYQVDAIDYLAKPITVAALLKAMQKAARYLQFPDTASEVTHAPRVLSVFDGHDYQFLPHDQIMRIEAEGSYARIFLKNNTSTVVSKRLRLLEQELQNRGFVRCHRSHLVNLQFIERFSKSQGGHLTLQNGDLVPVSGGYRADLGKHLNVS